MLLHNFAILEHLITSSAVSNRSLVIERQRDEELLRLEASLRAAGDTPEKLCFLHYPPRYRGYECPEILALLERYGVKECCYGHLHGSSHRLAIEGVHHGVTYRLCAADYTNFAPIRLR